MSQFFETPCKPDTAAGAIADYLRVKTPGAVVAAGALDQFFGVMDNVCVAAGPCTVRLRSAKGTRKMVAATAIAAGALVYGAAGGKVSSVANTNIEGMALEAASANNDVIEVIPVNAPMVNPVTTYAASGAIAHTPGTATISKTGSLAAMTLAAPTADQEGLQMRVVSQTAFAHTVTGNFDDGVTGGSKTTATFAAFAGASIELIASNAKWAVMSKNAVTLS